MIKKCIGCGVVLQNSDEEKVGYVKDIDKMDLCMRCFRMKNYREKSNLKPNYHNDEIITLINTRFNKCVFLVDILNINSEVIDTFKKITVPKILVISKLDIIPKSIKVNNILKRLRLIYQINEDVITISSLKSININLIRNFISEDKTCIAGFTNSGKSSLINALVNKDLVLTSNTVNTTLDFIKIEEDNLVFYDSPGLVYQNEYVKDLSSLTANKLIKPLIYQVKPNSGVKLDKIVLFNNSDKVCNMTFYTNNSLDIKKIFDKPTGTYMNLKLTNQDIVIKNIGFVSVRDAANLDISKIDDVIEVRETIFKVM